MVDGFGFGSAVRTSEVVTMHQRGTSHGDAGAIWNAHVGAQSNDRGNLHRPVRGMDYRALFVLVDGIGLAAGHQYDRAPGRKGGQRFVRDVEQ